MHINSIIKFFLIWSLCFASVFFVWQVCRSRQFAENSSQKTAAIYGGYSEVLLAKNKAVLQVGGDSILVDPIVVRAKSALIKAPLNDEVFSQIALAHTLTNSTLKIQGFFLEAQRRNIRNRVALKSLVALGVKQNDILAIIYNSDILLQLDRADASLYRSVIRELSENPLGREIVNTYLQKRPVWARPLLLKKISLMNIENILDTQTALSNFSRTELQLVEDKKIHESFIRKMIKLGAYNQAFSYWEHKLPEGENRYSLIHDSEFKGSLAFLPFNWHFIRRPKFFGKPRRLGGLYTSYNDSRQRILVEQILKLPPAQLYRLRIITDEWGYQERQGMFSWKIQCWQQKTVLLETNMGDRNRNKQEIVSDFYVPEEQCDVQKIQLVGQPAQYSKRIEVFVNSVNIIEVNP